MRKYKFTQFKDKYTWSNGEIKLQFSKPSIQSHDEYTYLEDEKGIMYNYYTVKIFKNVCVDYDNKTDKPIYKWKVVTKRLAYDFPTICQLKWILNHVLYELNPVISGQKHEYRSGKVKYSNTFRTEGFACDDFYEITKFADENNENPNYVLYIGCTFDSQGDLNSEGIRTPYTHEDDVKELLKCVEGFIKYTIDKHNEGVKKYIKEQSSNKIIRNGKLYQYNDGKLKSIHVVGDSGDFTILINKDNAPESVYYGRVTITKLSGNIVSFSDGREVDVQSITYISDKINEEKLKYGIKEIANDFLKILDNDELNEFRNDDTDSLFKKYRDAIVARTRMCRHEHGFDNVDVAVKDVILKIKGSICA